MAFENLIRQLRLRRSICGNGSAFPVSFLKFFAAGPPPGGKASDKFKKLAGEAELRRK
jgi:hypothetical protein